jgi:hypothetical protein
MDSAVNLWGAAVRRSDFVSDQPPSASMAPSRLHLADETHQIGVFKRHAIALATGTLVRHASMPERLAPTR